MGLLAKIHPFSLAITKPLLIGAVVAVVFTYGVDRMFGPASSLFDLLVRGTSLTILYGLLTVAAGFSKEEREVARDLRTRLLAGKRQ